MELNVLEPLPQRYDLAKIDLPLSYSKLLPSIENPPILELKVLPNHLTYDYLGNNETLPVIIASNLSNVQEERLLRVLKDHKSAIGWTIADIKAPRLSLQCAAQLQMEGCDILEHTMIHDDQSLYQAHAFLLVDGRYLNTIITPAAYGFVSAGLSHSLLLEIVAGLPRSLLRHNLMDCPTASYTFPPSPG
ncbi:hypothetical protein POM88_035832 [Heracleum sosnowskyi]|uniref:Uncharacterized protein n=1 Tax=Heracleum sosnowskyi TaxID=360622 RepID=A0AAD8HM21_9APIA|nr:hypothetical protein POM88_035832 [Heracleum sosnowskyi]